MVYSKQLTKIAFLAILALPVCTQTSQVVVEHALSQIDVLSTIVDTIGQNLASGAASNLTRKMKRSIQGDLRQIRKSMDDVKQFVAIHIDKQQEYLLVRFTSEIIKILDKVLKSNLSVRASFDFEKLKQPVITNDKIEKEIQTLLKQNDAELIALIKKSESIGLSKINIFYRNGRKFWKEWNLGSKAEHVAVYSALLVWWVYVTSESKLGEMFDTVPGLGWLRGRIVKFKKSVGESPYPITSQVETPANTTEVISQPVPLFDANGMPVMANVMNAKGQTVKVPVYKEKGKLRVFGPYNPNYPFLTRIPDPDSTAFFKKEITADVQKGAYDIELATEEGNDIIVPTGKLTDTSETKSQNHSALTIIQGGINGIVAFDNKTPIFSISVGLLFKDYIKQDYADFSEWAKKQMQRIDDYFFGTTKKVTYDDLTIRTERFSDIVGREDVKAEFQRVVEYICNPDRFDRAGIKVERGYLLAGEPQTGKTLMAKALAGEISAALEKQGKTQKVRLFEICMDALLKKGIAYYMELAKTQAPCILFLDELDLMRLQRDGDTKSLSEFLTSMSGSLNSNEKEHVIILAATNKPENVDFALRQHGRFGKMFWFDKPTFKHRVEFFVKEFEKRCMNTIIFNFETLAQQTEGCSFGTLDIVTKKGLMLAKLDSSPVTQSHFEAAINFEVKKLIPHGYTVPADKEQIVAARQAGKAIISITLNPAKMLCTVTVLPITQELEEEHVTQHLNIPGFKKSEQRAVRLGGIFAYHLNDMLDIETQEELIKQCKILLAGNVAQRVFGLESCAFDKKDKQDAFNLAKRIVFEGLDSKEVAKVIREEKLTAAYRLLEEYEIEIEKILNERKKELSSVIEALQKHKTLSVGQVKEIMGLV